MLKQRRGRRGPSPVPLLLLPGVSWPAQGFLGNPRVEGTCWELRQQSWRHMTIERLCTVPGIVDAAASLMRSPSGGSEVQLLAAVPEYQPPGRPRTCVDAAPVLSAQTWCHKPDRTAKCTPHFLHSLICGTPGSHLVLSGSTLLLQLFACQALLFCSPNCLRHICPFTC